MKFIINGNQFIIELEKTDSEDVKHYVNSNLNALFNLIAIIQEKEK